MKRSNMLMAVVGASAMLVASVGCSSSKDANGKADTANADSARLANAAAAITAPADSTAGGFIDPNTASATQLATIPGIDSSTASALVAGRPYATMTGVDSVLSKGKLTEAQRDSVYTRLWKPIDLNTASDREIQLIPGVGAKMLREFKEYRPYPQMDKFRREIGKYADKTEVARLERYVTIK